MDVGQQKRKTVRIMGTQGIPANYGGFETAAENIARFLVLKGWRVVVYCQRAGKGPMEEDFWNGIERSPSPSTFPDGEALRPLTGYAFLTLVSSAMSALSSVTTPPSFTIGCVFAEFLTSSTWMESSGRALDGES